jgi:hypothetical protein
MPRLTSAQRREIVAQARTQDVATPYVMQSPIGGINTKDALADMPETDAVYMDNLFCQPGWVEVRGGKQKLATFSGIALTLMAFQGILTTPNQLFAAVKGTSSNNIYRVDNCGGGPVGSPVVSGLSSAQIDYVQFGTFGGDYLIAVTNSNADSPYIYDGTTWQAVTTMSSPFAWTGGPALTSINQVASYKSRLWFVQGNTMNVYYLPQNVVAGAMTLLNMGPLFSLGGYIAAMITISIDNSAGTNDYIAFMSSQGEIVMFQGYDPSNVSTWYEAAHFRVGAPVGIGRTCWQKLGMDAGIICEDGLVLLSEAMLTDRSQQKDTLSDKVRFGINQNLQLYSGFLGWQVLLYPAGNKLLLNVPIDNARGSSFTWVMNTLTGAWSTWGQYASPMNAQCWENFNNLLYFGGTGVVEQADVGSSDDGVAISWTCKQAFNYFGEKASNKRFTLAKPTFQASSGLSVSIYLSVDFANTMPTGTVPITNGASAKWNVSPWNTTYWGDAQQVVSPWVGLTGDGYAAALVFSAATANLTAKWMSTLVMFESGGTLYGK